MEGDEPEEEVEVSRAVLLHHPVDRRVHGAVGPADGKRRAEDHAVGGEDHRQDVETHRERRRICRRGVESPAHAPTARNTHVGTPIQ